MIGEFKRLPLAMHSAAMEAQSWARAMCLSRAYNLAGSLPQVLNNPHWHASKRNGKDEGQGPAYVGRDSLQELP